MAGKTCSSCRHYGKVETVPGHKALGCTLHLSRLQKSQKACGDYKKRKSG